jgi:hypothetical protein
MAGWEGYGSWGCEELGRTVTYGDFNKTVCCCMGGWGVYASPHGVVEIEVPKGEMLVVGELGKQLC